MTAAPLVISAADVEKYGYCPLSWWLSRGEVDETGEEIRSGVEKHEQMGEEVLGIERHEHRARESETTVLYFALAATIIAVLGISVATPLDFPFTLILSIVSLIWLLAAVYLLYRAERLTTASDRLLWERVVLAFSMVATIAAVLSVTAFVVSDPLFGPVSEVAALLWLIGASFFLQRNLLHLRQALTARAKYGATQGNVSYVDHPQAKSDVLESERYGLRGKPDYVITVGEHMIPVEVKTGRTPRGPLFSHIMQVAAYCLLVEETTGKAPPHGVIKYEEASHEIEYNADLKKLILGKLEEMRRAAARGEAHRNHQRPGKCIHCSRREGCPERLA